MELILANLPNDADENIRSAGTRTRISSGDDRCGRFDNGGGSGDSGSGGGGKFRACDTPVTGDGEDNDEDGCCDISIIPSPALNTESDDDVFDTRPSKKGKTPHEGTRDMQDNEAKEAGEVGKDKGSLNKTPRSGRNKIKGLDNDKNGQPDGNMDKGTKKSGSEAHGGVPEVEVVENQPPKRPSNFAGPDTAQSTALAATGIEMNVLATLETEPFLVRTAQESAPIDTGIEEVEEKEPAFVRKPELNRDDDDEHTQTDIRRSSIPPDANDDDDEETLSDPEFRSPAARRTQVASTNGVGGGLTLAERWRCSCGCLMKAGRRLCRMCGSATAACSITATASSSPAVSAPPSLSPSLKPRLDKRGGGPSSPLGSLVGMSSSSPTEHSNGPSLGVGGGLSIAGDSQVSTTSSTSSQSQASTLTSDNSVCPRDQLGRWQCGCGCRMRAGGKRCIMCGQSSPSNVGKSLLSDGCRSDRDGSLDVVENGKSNQTLEKKRHRDSGSLRIEAASSSTEASPAFDVGVPLTPAGKGRWQCTNCESEYNATRMKCRACGTPRSARPKRAVPSDTTEVSDLATGTCPTKSLGHTDSIATEKASSSDLPKICPVESERIGKVRSVGGGVPVKACGKREQSSVRNMRDLCASGSGAGSPKLRRPKKTTHVESGATSLLDETACTPKRRLAAADGAGTPVGTGTSSDTSLEPTPETTTAAGDGGSSSLRADSSQSQDDNLGELFPSLHRFEVDEDAAAGGDGSSRFRDSFGWEEDTVFPKVGNDSSIKISGFDAQRSLLAPAPPLLLSVPPVLASAAPAGLPEGNETPVVHELSFGGLLLPPPPVLAPAPTAVNLSGSPSKDQKHKMSLSNPFPGREEHAFSGGVKSSKSLVQALPPGQEATDDLAPMVSGFSASSPGRFTAATVDAADSGASNPVVALKSPTIATASDTRINKGARQGKAQGERGWDGDEDQSGDTSGSAPSPKVPLLPKDGASYALASAASGNNKNNGAKGYLSKVSSIGQAIVGTEGDQRLDVTTCRTKKSSAGFKGKLQRGGSKIVQHHGENCQQKKEKNFVDNGKIGTVCDDGGGGGYSSLGDAARKSSDDDDVACGVCGSATSKEDDPIILCDGPKHCGTAVHADCYGVAEVPEGPWLCDPCSEIGSSDIKRRLPIATTEVELEATKQERCCNFPCGISPPCCALCRHSGGALKYSRCGHWVHVVCVWWTPELASDPETVRPGSLAGLDPDRAGLTCSTCHDRGGAVVQCAAPSCLESCHPFCAMRAGFLLREDGGVFDMFCRTHSRRERREEGARTTEPTNTGADENETRQDNGRAVTEVTKMSDVEVAVVTTPAVRKGEEGSRRTTPPTCVATPPPPMPCSTPGIVELGTGVDVDNKPREPGQERDEGEQVPLTIDFSQSQALPPRPSGRFRLNKKKAMLLDLGDDDDDEEEADAEEADASNAISIQSSTSTPVAAAGKTAGGSGSKSGTPLKVFNMAPPTQLPHALSSTDGEESPAPPVQRRTLCGRLFLPPRTVNDMADSPSLHLARGGKRGGEEGADSPVAEEGNAELMTLSQAISPVSEERKKSKRRRLHKVRKLIYKYLYVFSLYVSSLLLVNPLFLHLLLQKLHIYIVGCTAEPPFSSCL